MSLRRVANPRPYQRQAIDFLLSTPRANLYMGMGMGKSLSTLLALDTLYFAGAESDPCLILGPLRVARDTWPDEVTKWEQFRGLEVIPIIGETPKQREAALRRRGLIYSINYENLPWLVHYFGNRWPFKIVVADESTRLKGFRLKQGGARARALGQVAHSFVKRWINLTGTPSPNGLPDLWGQNWFIDRGKRLGHSYSDFIGRWFYREAMHGGPAYAGKLNAFKHSEAEIHGLLRDVCLTLDPKDWFDLEEPVVTQIGVKLPAEARKIYDDLEKDMFAQLDELTELEVVNAAALTMKCLQLANGAVICGDKGEWKAVHDEKLQALESIAQEVTDVPLLVQYNFRSDAERILKVFPKAAQLATKQGMQRFRDGASPIGMAHAKSMGHGIDGLQAVTNTLVRFGHDWNAEERLQMLERIGPVRQAQSGFKRPVRVFDIVAEDTVDISVLERHKGKLDIMSCLLAAMKSGYKAATTAETRE